MGKAKESLEKEKEMFEQAKQARKVAMEEGASSETNSVRKELEAEMEALKLNHENKITEIETMEALEHESWVSKVEALKERKTEEIESLKKETENVVDEIVKKKTG